MQTPEKVVERIRRLYAMAQDAGSPNEAAIAARRCRKLMDEYQLTAADLEKSDFARRVVKQGKRISKWYVHLSIQVAELNDCQFHRSDEGQCLFRGLDADVIVATLTLQYLVDSLERQWKTYRKHETTANATSFKMGFAVAIGKRIQTMIKIRQQLKASNGTSLIVSKKRLVENEFGIVRYTRSSYKSNDSRAFDAGNRAGMKTGLDNQMSEKRRASLES